MPPEDRHGFEGVTFLPPAARGDVDRASQEFDAILLIDGVFHHDLAPSPKECYRAAQRVRAFGASSMGALRAAECAPYGFLPLGAIARWYACETIDGDDEVAMLVHPETHAALTVPSVNVRYVARLAQRRGFLTGGEAANLIDEARAIFYMDRTWEDVAALVPSRVRDAVRAIAEREGDLKRWDARFALRSVVRRLARPAPAKTD
ncbi:MAG TPA: TfuA-like protein [Candidatus Acidoferrales bacterium]|nr:TfuA-like protein [Candidatus Acidoferrales bacterium]